VCNWCAGVVWLWTVNRDLILCWFCEVNTHGWRSLWCYVYVHGHFTKCRRAKNYVLTAQLILQSDVGNFRVTMSSRSAASAVLQCITARRSATPTPYSLPIIWPAISSTSTTKTLAWTFLWEAYGRILSSPYKMPRLNFKSLFGAFDAFSGPCDVKC